MMDMQATAQIYLADQRGCLKTDVLRSYHTFNFGHYQAEGRAPFRSLNTLNDDTLRAGASLPMRVPHDTTCVLLPVSGGLHYANFLMDEQPVDGFLEPGQVGVFHLPARTTYTISNPYEEKFINFLQIWLTHSSSDFKSGFSQFSFDLSQKNTLLPLFGGSVGGRGCIGQYSGRQEDVYPVHSSEDSPPTSAVFIFVLQGAFEVQNRLLHEKDGLALLYPQSDAVEFEALSNDATLILLAIP